MRAVVKFDYVRKCFVIARTDRVISETPLQTCGRDATTDEIIGAIRQLLPNQRHVIEFHPSRGKTITIVITPLYRISHFTE